MSLQAPRQSQDLVLPYEWCFVICHGLVSELHLNGSLGEVIDFHDESDGHVVRCEVHFD